MADKNKGLSLREKIKACNDIESVLVDIPEWGCKIEMRTPTSREASALEEWSAAHAPKEGDDPDPSRFRGLKEQYIMACAYDPDSGKQLFGLSDMDWLGDKNAKVIERLWRIAQGLVGLTPEEEDDLGKVSGAKEAA